jgi:hypothetical protein
MLLPMLSDKQGRDFWEAYMGEYIKWKRNPTTVEEYKQAICGFDPDDIMGGVDCDGAPWGAHPFVKTNERPAAVNWAIVRALFWTPWRITNYIIKETGRNQAHPDGALAAQFLSEAQADQMVQDL